MPFADESRPIQAANAISTLILAGGQSTRMGQDKASIPVDGIPMLRRVYDVAAQCTETVTVVTPWPERYRSLMPAACQWSVEPVPEEGADKSRGPLIGFTYGLAQLQTMGRLTPWDAVGL